MNFVNNPNIGPFTALTVALVSAVMDALTAFHVDNFTDAQRTAVLGVLTAATALGFFLYAVLQSWHAVTAARLAAMGYPPVPAPRRPTPPSKA